jgi:DNA-binding XRE family transcriptional regulator
MVNMVKKKRETDAPESPLKVLRRKVQLTQEQLAKLLGVSTRAVQAWEGGEYQPSLTIPQIKALCRALNCSLEDLPDEFGTPKRSPEEET